MVAGAALTSGYTEKQDKALKEGPKKGRILDDLRRSTTVIKNEDLINRTAGSNRNQYIRERAFPLCN